MTRSNAVGSGPISMPQVVVISAYALGLTALGFAGVSLLTVGLTAALLPPLIVAASFLSLAVALQVIDCRRQVDYSRSLPEARPAVEVDDDEEIDEADVILEPRVEESVPSGVPDGDQVHQPFFDRDLETDLIEEEPLARASEEDSLTDEEFFDCEESAVDCAFLSIDSGFPSSQRSSEEGPIGGPSMVRGPQSGAIAPPEQDLGIADGFLEVLRTGSIADLVLCLATRPSQ